MLTEEQKQLLPERIAQRIEKINEEYLQMIGRRIKEIGTLSATDAHRMSQMREYGADVEKITQELAEISEKNIAEIYEIYDLVAQDNAEFSEQFFEAVGKEYIPYQNNEALKRLVYALAKQTAETYMNLSQTTGFMMYDKSGKKVFTSLSKTYQNVIDDAVMRVVTGEQDYQSAMRSTLRNLADSGIRTKYSPLYGAAGKAVDYASGYSRRLDTAVRQNILWGVKQCNISMQEQLGKEFGADGYEIDYHANPRPSHAAMGGRQYVIGRGREINGQYYPPFDSVSYLLSDYGCLHFKWSIICGVSVPTWSSRELEMMKARDQQTFTYEGKQYTGYEATQIQRKLETAARHAKDRQIIAKAAGDDELRRLEQQKINAITQQYKAFSAAAGLPTRMERMSVSGYRRVRAANELTNARSSDIITINKNIGAVDVETVGRLNTKLFDKAFGKLNTDEVVLTDERRLHILSRHKEDYSALATQIREVIEKPDYILRDEAHAATAFMIKQLQDTNLNIIIKLAVIEDEKHPKNSIMTMYRIRDKNVKKLLIKHETIYKLE